VHTDDPEIITGGTPLECELHGVRPRVLLSLERLAQIRERLDEPAHALMLRRLREAADRYCPCSRRDGDEGLMDRGDGCAIPHLALAFLLTHEEKYLDSALHYLRTAPGCKRWRTDSLLYGHVSAGVALGYDWLHAYLDDGTRALVRDTLLERADAFAFEVGTHQGWGAGIYACNHYPVGMFGLLAAGAALYDDIDRAAPFLRLCQEKFRLMVEALGPDGASQEGIGYGQYYAEFLLKGLVVLRDLLGLDLLKGSEWLRNLPMFYLYSHLPHDHWQRGDAILIFGDGYRTNWYGPGDQLRLLAREFRDPVAQGFADQTQAAGVEAGVGSYLNLLWHDPTVKPLPPEDLPRLRHFDDMDLVFMRSGWDGDAALAGFKCGPHCGHYALEKYSHDVGGGHMCPDAGSLQIFAHGNRLIVDDRYSAKFTDQQNTVIINGNGQTGEGQDWFESVRVRKEKRGASILRVETHGSWDNVIGNVAPAYDPELGVRRFLRHVLYIRPDCWVLVDELATEGVSTFDLYFHADQPFMPAGDSRFLSKADKGALAITCLSPVGATTRCFTQTTRENSGHPAVDLQALVIANPEPVPATVFVTVLQAFPTDGEEPGRPQFQDGVLRLPDGSSWQIQSGQADPAARVYTPCS